MECALVRAIVETSHYENTSLFLMDPSSTEKHFVIMAQEGHGVK